MDSKEMSVVLNRTSLSEAERDSFNRYQIQWVYIELIYRKYNHIRLKHLLYLESEMSIMRETSSADPDAIQIVLQDLMRHILQLQSRRGADSSNRDEPTRLDVSTRQRQLSRQYRDTEGNAAGLREQLHASLNTVASHSSLGPQTLHRESTRLDGLVSGSRRYDSSPIRPDGH